MAKKMKRFAIVVFPQNTTIGLLKTHLMRCVFVDVYDDFQID